MLFLEMVVWHLDYMYNKGKQLKTIFHIWPKM